MKPYLKTAFTLFCGLTVFQLIASYGVYQSNIHLVRTMEQALSEGYLAVPNALVHESLRGVGMALAGGLFFTLTVGSLFTLLSLGASVLLRLYPLPLKIKLPVFSVWVLVMLAWINWNGFLAVESLGILVTCATVFILDHLFFRDPPSPKALNIFGLHTLFPLVLALILLLFTKGDNDRIFSDFRDTFLMNNPVGMAINDFYYTYTLSPAEVFKPMSKKIIKSVVLDSDPADKVMIRRIQQRLLAFDYLPLAGVKDPDLRIEYKGGMLSFFENNRMLDDVQFQQFMKHSAGIISKISQTADAYGPYRIFTHTGLLTGFPLLMYLLLHMVLFFPLALFLSPFRAGLSASVACFALGVCGFILLFMMNPVNLTQQEIPAGLSSGDLPTRLAALHLIHDEKANIMNYPEAVALYSSPHVVERYWAARASAFSRNPETHDRLLALLNDPNLNVQTQACYALGKSRSRKAIKPILEHISTTPHWYVQWYAYKALKRLGWKQKKSAP